MTASISQLGAVSAKNKAATQDVLNAAASAGINLEQVWGVGGGDHADGYATDFMVYSNKAWGNWIADFLWLNRDRLGVRWIIWQQRIRSTSPGKSGNWEAMEDRGTPTLNHMDHCHVKWNTADIVSLPGGGQGGSIPVVKPPAPKPSTAPPPPPTFVAPPRWGATNELLNDENLRLGVSSTTATIYNPKLWSWLWWQGGVAGQAFCRKNYAQWMKESSKVFGPTSLAATQEAYAILNSRDKTHWPNNQTINPKPTWPGKALLAVLGFRADFM